MYTEHNTKIPANCMRKNPDIENFILRFLMLSVVLRERTYKYNPYKLVSSYFRYGRNAQIEASHLLDRYLKMTCMPKSVRRVFSLKNNEEKKKKSISYLHPRVILLLLVKYM